MKNNEYLDTRDYINISQFPILVCLTILGFKIVAFNRDPKNQGRVECVFEKTAKLDRAIRDYWEGNLAINLKDFYSKSRELKSRIMSIK